MAEQKGSDMVLRLGSIAASPTVYTALAGLRTKQIQLNAEQVDVSSADVVNKWRKLLAGAGLKSASVSGAGVFTDATVEADLRTGFVNQAHVNIQVEIPSFCTIEGLWQITGLSYAGEHNGEVTWDLSLESAGEMFVAAI